MAIDPVSFIPDGEEDLADWLSDTPIEEKEQAAKEVDSAFPGTVIFCGAPQVGEEKIGKLEGVLNKYFVKLGFPDGLSKYMPINPETNLTDGFFIITFDSEEQAKDAVDKFHGMEFDKKHTFKAYPLDEFQGIVNYDAPEPSRDSVEVTKTDVDDLRDWLLDEVGREQFVLRYDTAENEVMWHDPVTGAPTVEYGGEREKKGGKVWCDNKVQWSPQGSYLATFHKPGVALWGGEKFTKRARFLHSDVQHIEFSPNEEFLLTWNGKHAAEKDPASVKIWRIFTGEEAKSFPTPSLAPRGGEFPHYLWSPDGRFLARYTEGAIFVYDSQDDFEICKDPATEKRMPIKFPDGIHSFDWSPKENILSAWIPEKNNIPARLQLIKMPSRQELAAKNLFSVRDATINWHPEGRYVCVNAMRMSRSKKTGHTHLEIFRVMEKNVPVESVEIKETVKSFYWEQNGHRFCILTTDENNHGLKARFFALPLSGGCNEVGKYELQGTQITTVSWAPAGQYFCMAAIPGGDLIFGQLDQNNKLDILHKDEHFLLTEILWDPSSRYVISATTQAMSSGIRYQTEAGYKMWSFQGRQLYSFNKEKLFQIFWRPHPPSLQTEKQQQEVKTNLKTYSKRYEGIDDQQKDLAKVLAQKEREDALGRFQKILDRCNEYKMSKWEATGWAPAWAQMEAESKWTEKTEVIEEELEVKEEEITD
jgi:translation initiation factor 3 subunit B